MALPIEGRGDDIRREVGFWLEKDLLHHSSCVQREEHSLANCAGQRPEIAGVLGELGRVDGAEQASVHLRRPGAVHLALLVRPDTSRLGVCFVFGTASDNVGVKK